MQPVAESGGPMTYHVRHRAEPAFFTEGIRPQDPECDHGRQLPEFGGTLTN